MLKLVIFLATAVAVCSGEPDPFRKIIRPCDLRDHRCIRDNLAANSGCRKQVRGSVPAEYTLTNFAFETPFFNASYVDNTLTISNQDKCFVSEFFFNMEGDSCVLAVDCPQLGISSDRTLVQHWTHKEDTTYSYTIRGTYPLIRMTTNLKHADQMDLCSSYTLGDVTQLPIFHIDPNNKPTADFLTRDLTYLDIFERETFHYRAPQLFRTFVNAMLCDFGCNL